MFQFIFYTIALCSSFSYQHIGTNCLYVSPIQNNQGQELWIQIELQRRKKTKLTNIQEANYISWTQLDMKIDKTRKTLKFKRNHLSLLNLIAIKTEIFLTHQPEDKTQSSGSSLPLQKNTSCSKPSTLSTPPVYPNTSSAHWLPSQLFAVFQHPTWAEIPCTTTGHVFQSIKEASWSFLKTRKTFLLSLSPTPRKWGVLLIVSA